MKIVNFLWLVENSTQILALWGAVISTLLAILKVTEYWSNRFRIGISFVFRGHPNIGNDVTVQNLSRDSILLDYIEIYQKKGVWPFCKSLLLWSPEDETLNRRIEGKSGVKFNFREMDYFEPKKNSRLYIKLFVAGRRPIMKALR